MRRAKSRLVIAASFALAAMPVGSAASATEATAAARVPAGSAAPQPWMEYARPQEAGFSAEKLAAARAFADANQAAAVVAVYRGHAIAAWGAVDRNLMAHSVRKSFLGALLGIAVGEQKVALDATLARLGIDDEPPLTAAEKEARVRHLLAARSGVYHAAAYASSDQAAERPQRGSHLPGTSFYYNNWDFNALETIYERATGADVFAAFAARIARPLGMEDYEPAAGLAVLEPSNSRLPAHAFRVSARDMARFGLLYLQEGRWGDTQLVPRDWVRESLRAHSDLGQGAGYGYLWWTYAPGSLGDEYPQLDRGPVHLARGTGGQAIFVIPGAEMVVVHRGDTDNGRSVRGPQIWSLVEQLVAAREGAPVAQPALRPMAATPLASQLPAPPAQPIVALPLAQLRELAGSYELGKGAIIRVYLHDDRLFMNVPGQGEAELFATSPTEFTLRVMPGVRVAFARDAEGRVAKVQATIGPQRLEAPRQP